MKFVAWTVIASVCLFVARAEAAVAGKYFDRAIIVVLENTDYNEAIHQPFLSELARSGVNLTHFTAETHPSQPNYIAMTAGGPHGVRTDQNVDLNIRHIGDLLEERGYTWKVYAEDYPGGCFKGARSKGYARKHNPFMSYRNVRSDEKRCGNIVPANQFQKDRISGRLPNYSFYVPNLKNDGHDTGVAFADKWYRRTFAPVVSDTKLMSSTILITTFDEGTNSGDNQIYTSIVGASVRPGGVVNQNLTFYSLLKLMEENWNLANLGERDVAAAPIPNIWK